MSRPWNGELEPDLDASLIPTRPADPELREQMTKAGRQRVERHYSWRSIAQQTYDLYRRLRPQRS